MGQSCRSRLDAVSPTVPPAVWTRRPSQLCWRAIRPPRNLVQPWAETRGERRVKPRIDLARAASALDHSASSRAGSIREKRCGRSSTLRLSLNLFPQRACLPIGTAPALDRPDARILCGAGVLAVAAAILVTNAHWLTDVLAGGFLGAWVGWMTTTSRKVLR